ncbi:MAG: hypothetical protein ACLFV6_12600 [Spirulinaceae cyanobacterium]
MTANPPLQSLIAELDRLSAIASEEETVSVSAEFLQRLREVLVAGNAASPEINADAIAQAVVERLHHRSLTPQQPPLPEVTALRQQRDLLHREIQNLEAQRQQLIGDFLQVLLSRVSEALKQEISQTVESIESQFLYAIAPPAENTTEAAVALTNLPGNPSQRLEQLKYLQQESDRLFMTLDSTFHTVFDTLQKDLNSYQEALTQGSARLYDLAQPNPNPAPTDPFPNAEIPLALPLDLQEADTEPNEVETGQTYPRVTPVQLPDQEMLYPFPGMELPASNPEIIADSPDEPATPASNPEPIDVDTMDESEIDALLQLDEANATENPEIAEPTQPWENSLFGQDAAVTLPSEASFTPESPAPESEAPSAVEVSLDAADTPEAQLFGETETDTPESATAEAGVVEQELFSEPTAAVSIESQIPPESESVAAHSEVTTTTTTAPTIKETISSLTELLEQAYVDEDEDNELTPFTPVPVGENLWATAETEVNPSPAVSSNLDSEQLEQLNEDLQRFQAGSNPEEPTGESSQGESVPAELMGEDLEQVSIESLDSDSEEDMWAEAPAENASEDIKMPAEINPEPWSGSTPATPESSADDSERPS